ncbi:MAG: hypothetical protein EB078_05070 [Proteobacteria bacterium]|nr:hypothetical protein [Pseudomonadota bacterium]NDC23684.1 hypothetical protein [Pseudomonadota bacterium]NDD04256.1 hypothetical protein [Pseudomonadota bacterium]NDG25571.1 hypothetical protein [Pseudomonadota bacterium]
MKLFTAVVILFSTLLLAEPEEFVTIDQVHVEGRAFTHSCSYFSNIEANLSVRFRKPNMEPNTRVFLLYGWGGTEQTHGTSFIWREQKEVEMNLIERHLWQLDLTQILLERSSPILIKDLHFAIRINEPGKTPYYEAIPGNGISYLAHILENPEKTTCVSSGSDLPEMEPLVVQIIPASH